MRTLRQNSVKTKGKTPHPKDRTGVKPIGFYSCGKPCTVEQWCEWEVDALLDSYGGDRRYQTQWLAAAIEDGDYADELAPEQQTAALSYLNGRAS